jgi:excisionase family DNA binding protein
MSRRQGPTNVIGRAGERLSFSLQGAAEASSLSLRTLSDAIRRGELRSFKRGRRRIILRDDLEAYLRST